MLAVPVRAARLIFIVNLDAHLLLFVFHSLLQPVNLFPESVIIDLAASFSISALQDSPNISQTHN